MQKKYFNYFINVVFGIVAIYFLYARAPSIYNNFVLENSKLEYIDIIRLSGDRVTVPNPNHNLILMFWATWCGACHVEMEKIKEMMAQGELKPEDFIAVSVDEKKEGIDEFLEKNKFRFLAAHDSDGTLAKRFKISSTPTFIFVNKNKQIEEVTSGISLDIKTKVRNFLKN